MKIENHQAVVAAQTNVMQLLSSRSKSNRVKFNTDEIFGNEKLLSPKLIKKLVAARKNRLFAVLREQARQRESGEEDQAAIARASQQFSKADVSRARTIG